MKKREIRIDGDVAYVPLTRGYEAMIDAEDAHLVSSWNWYAEVTAYTVYASRTDKSDGHKTCVRMHQAILGGNGDLTPDHIDHDGLNNRRENIRWATKAQQQHNKRTPRHNSSGIKGVTWDACRGKWLAGFAFQGKYVNAGRFLCKAAAAVAVQSARRKIHADFAQDR